MYTFKKPDFNCTLSLLVSPNTFTRIIDFPFNTMRRSVMEFLKSKYYTFLFGIHFLSLKSERHFYDVLGVRLIHWLECLSRNFSDYLGNH